MKIINAYALEAIIVLEGIALAVLHWWDYYVKTQSNTTAKMYNDVPPEVQQLLDFTPCQLCALHAYYFIALQITLYSLIAVSISMYVVRLYRKFSKQKS